MLIAQEGTTNRNKHPAETPAEETQEPDAAEGTQKQAPAETPADGTTQEPDATEETEEEGSVSERLNPETDVPEEGTVIGDGDNVSMVDNFCFASRKRPC